MRTIFWLGNLNGKTPLGRPRRKWEDNIRKDLREVGWEVEDWMHLAQDREPVAGYREHDNELSGSMTSRKIFDYLSDYQLLKNESAP
jgi:hypothetical protein